MLFCDFYDCDKSYAAETITISLRRRAYVIKSIYIIHTNINYRDLNIVSTFLDE